MRVVILRLAMAKEKAELEQAKAKLVEEQNRQAALELRQAELEIERYDRRIAGLPPVASAESGTEDDAEQAR